MCCACADCGLNFCLCVSWNAASWLSDRCPAGATKHAFVFLKFSPPRNSGFAADIVQYRGGLVPNLMSWLLVLFSKEQGKRMRTLGVRAGSDNSHASPSMPQFQSLGAPPGRPLSLQDGLSRSFRKVQIQASSRYAPLFLVPLILRLATRD